MNKTKYHSLRTLLKLLTRLGMLLAILLVTSCCRTNMTGVNLKSNSFCSLYYPVYYDTTKDTPETIGSINVNNALYEQCPF